MEEIINKVANSGLINFDLEQLYPEGKRIQYDISENLWQGLALKEKDFRAFVKEHDWSQYQDCYVSVYCSVDAIIPSWAYMLLASSLQPYAKRVVFGDLEALETVLYRERLNELDLKPYEGEKVIIKGCSKKPVPTDAYITIVQKLQQVAQSIMYGEACSTVPIYKKPKVRS